MQRFSISPDNRIQAIEGKQELTEGASAFRSEQELLELSAGWPATRLAEIWNGLAEVKTVKKFMNRAAGVTRIWNQIQTLTPRAKENEVSVNDAAKPVSKKEQVLALLQAEAGITLAQLMSATGWQKHSVRGFLSGTVVRKMGLQVLSFKNADGERAYRVVV